MRSSMLPTRLEWLCNISSELKQARFTIELFTNELNLLVRPISLNKEIGIAWDDLELCLPRWLCNNYLYPTFNEKIRLIDLQPDIKYAFSNLKNQPNISWNVPEVMCNINIWRDTTNRYWYTLFLTIVSWCNLTDAKLKEFSWSIDEDYIVVTMMLECVPISIVDYALDDTDGNFLIVSFLTDKGLCYKQASEMLLIYLQMLARCGGHEFILTEMNGNMLTTKLRISMGDTTPFEKSTSLVPEATFKIFIDEIVNRMSTNFVEVSKLLEAALLQEVHDLSQSTEKNSTEKLSESLMDAIQMLQIIREKLSR